MIIVIKNKQYGVWNAETGEAVLENKYEEIKDSSKEKIEEYEKWKKMLKEIQDLL